MTLPSKPPTGNGDRIAVVDLLRGAALFGILSVNIWFFASASVSAGEIDPDFASVPDRLAAGLTTFLFATKSYLLFAFLFGYSFVLQERAAQRSGRPFARLMRRRMSGLIVLGLLHGILLFPGDILVTYGLLGFVLLAMRRLDPGAAVRRGIMLTVIAGGTMLLLGGLVWIADGGAPDQVPGAAQAVAADYRGEPWGVLLANAAAYPSTLASVLFVQGLPAMGAMLVGLAAARVEFFSDARRQSVLWRRLMPAGTVIGLLGAAAFTWAWATGSVGPLFVGFGVTVLTAPFLTATYVALLSRWYHASPNGVVVQGIAAAGQLALTNYLVQSLVLAVLFTGYGLALMEQVSAVQTAAIVVSIYTVQVVASALWRRSHRYGPAEWVLRRWTLAGDRSGRRSLA